MTRKMYDSVDPNAIPIDAQMVAGYIDGTKYKWPESSWDRFPNAVKVRIARRVTTNDGHVLDVEFGIPTVWPPSQAIVKWVLMRRQAGIEPTIYCNELNDWSGIKKLFTDAGVAQPQYWVARYNNEQNIPAGAVAKQYINPTGSGGPYDLSVVADIWPGVDNVETNVTDINPDQIVPVTYPSNRSESTSVKLGVLLGDSWVIATDMAKGADDASSEISLRKMIKLLEEIKAQRFDYQALANAIVDVAAERGIIGLSAEVFKNALKDIRITTTAE